MDHLISIGEIIVTPLKRISVSGGDVMHAMKNTDPGFAGFGESYFSLIEYGVVKAWKQHRLMTLNLVVPVGEVRFVFFSQDKPEQVREVIIGHSNYARITVPPYLWFGFQGLAKENSLVLNMANILHDPTEVLKHNISFFSFDWSLK
jgi:dTDP-4-dehydrorhamnose 3,5-epimerase